MKAALVCIAKDEDFYIDEWIHYHLALGFEHIFIYANDWHFSHCNSNVSVIPIVGKQAQCRAYMDFKLHKSTDFHWAAFFDVDEFLVLNIHKTLPDFLTEYNGCSAIGINWAIFGNNNTSVLDTTNYGYSVLKRFTKRAAATFGPNKHIKTIVRLPCHLPQGVHNVKSRWFNLNKQTRDGSFNSPVDYSIAQLNHYFTKSDEEFYAKCQRGRADSLDKRSFSKHLGMLNANAIEDTKARDFFYKNRGSTMTLPYNIADEDIDLLQHSSLFDNDWYLARYRDVQLLDITPVQHFLWLGNSLGRSPSQQFCAPSYCNAHNDVKRSGLNPLIHYLRYGIKEGRMIYPVQAKEDSYKLQQCKRKLAPRNRDFNWAVHDDTLRRFHALPHPFTNDMVSIIMPTHNRAELISKAIRSALAQSHAKFELIIVNDSSTDETSQVVAAFEDSRIIYTTNRHTKGVSGARNTGLDMAQGKWVFFLDSDNAWKPSLLEFLLKHAAASQSSAGYCAANIHDDAGQTKSILYADFDFESCLRDNYIDLNCFFMRWAGPFCDFRFDEELRRLVDWDFILRVASSTRITGVPFVGVDYYDGTNKRITNMEHVDRKALAALQNRIRAKVRQLTVEPIGMRDASSYRIAVLLHIYHADRVQECIEYLRNITVAFDLYVSTSLDEGHEALVRIQSAYPHVLIFFYPNCGADIAPFLELISTFKPYALVLKVHTKRDVEPWGSAWRKGLLDPVLGSSRLVNELLNRFRTNHKLAMACSANFYKHGRRNTIPSTMQQVEVLAEKIGLSHFLDKDWAFVAGTMFWVRPQLLLKVARTMCDSDGYTAAFLRDGGIEHGIERLLGLALWQCEDNQVAVVSMDGTVEEKNLGEGFTIEGVSQTMRRLQRQ